MRELDKRDPLPVLIPYVLYAALAYNYKLGLHRKKEPREPNLNIKQHHLVSLSRTLSHLHHSPHGYVISNFQRKGQNFFKTKLHKIINFHARRRYSKVIKTKFLTRFSYTTFEQIHLKSSLLQKRVPRQ